MRHVFFCRCTRLEGRRSPNAPCILGARGYLLDAWFIEAEKSLSVGAGGHDLKPKLLITTSTLPNDEHDPEPRFVVDLAIASTGISKSASSPLAAWVPPRLLPSATSRSAATPTLPGVGDAVLPGRDARSASPTADPLGIGAAAHERPISRDTASYGGAEFCLRSHPLAGAPSLWSRPGTASKSRMPYIAIAHGADVHAMNGVLGSAMLRTAIRRASGVVGASQLAARNAAAEGSRPRWIARPTTVIGTGVDTEKFSPALRCDEWAATHDVSRPVILYVGRLQRKRELSFSSPRWRARHWRPCRPRL